MKNSSLLRLVTFDGEARSGKGTIVGRTKDYLRDECGYRVMLIDAGQVFRVLVVAAGRAGVDVDNPAAIDAFLDDDDQVERCVALVKEVYHMTKADRDDLLYTNDVSANSAKIGARPRSQQFKDMLLRKWLGDAASEGYDVVLLDGRALEEVGTMLADEGLCQFVLGLYFVCDPVVGAMRTLGFADSSYDDLSADDRQTIDDLVAQIETRNAADAARPVQPIVRPTDAPVVQLPASIAPGEKFYIIDTSAPMTRDDMAAPVGALVQQVLAAHATLNIR